MYNQYDLSRIYGFPTSMPPVSLPGGTLPDMLSENIPSIQEITQYASNQGQQQGVIDVPQILSGNNNLTQNTSGGLTGLRPAPERLDTIPITQDVVQGALTPSGGTGAVSDDSIEYLNGLIRTQIGRRARIDFLLGSSGMVTKDGYILGVGSNYILINEVDTDDITACDFYNIKFIRFFY